MSAHAKICGLTTPDTLDAALAGGAAFVGAVVFPKSPRHIDPLHGATLFERARNRAKIVAVTVDADDALLTEIALILKPDLIQLHGHETREQAERVRMLTGAAIIKVLPIRTAEDFAEGEAWESGRRPSDVRREAARGLASAGRGRGAVRLGPAGRPGLPSSVVRRGRSDPGQCGAGDPGLGHAPGGCVLWRGNRAGC
jgi:hypothetical protein